MISSSWAKTVCPPLQRLKAYSSIQNKGCVFWVCNLVFNNTVESHKSELLGEGKRWQIRAKREMM